jgi:hypothetical protein
MKADSSGLKPARSDKHLISNMSITEDLVSAFVLAF